MIQWSEADWIKNGEAYSRISESRHTTVYPWILAQVSQLNPSRILDFGAGDGRLLKQISCQRTCVAAYYDPSRSMRLLAKETLKGSGLPLHKNLIEIDDIKYDVIIFCAVWMVLSTKEECIRCLNWMRDHLTSEGVILFAVTHPCFRDIHFRSFSTDFSQRRYLESGSAFRVFIRDDQYGVVIQDYHWSLSEMFDQVRQCRLWFDLILELPDLDDGEPARGYPPWLVGLLRPRV